ncbi:MAG: hypothetical protein ACE5G0_15725 [Rhodothermales bacterium]
MNLQQVASFIQKGRTGPQVRSAWAKYQPQRAEAGPKAGYRQGPTFEAYLQREGRMTHRATRAITPKQVELPARRTFQIEERGHAMRTRKVQIGLQGTEQDEKQLVDRKQSNRVYVQVGEPPAKEPINENPRVEPEAKSETKPLAEPTPTPSKPAETYAFQPGEWSRKFRDAIVVFRKNHPQVAQPDLGAVAARIAKEITVNPTISETDLLTKIDAWLPEEPAE